MAYTPTSTRGIAAAASKNPTTSVTSSPETQRVTYNNKKFSVPVGSSKEYIQARASNIDATNRGGTQTDLTQFQNPTNSNTSVNSTNMSDATAIPVVSPTPAQDYSSILTTAQNQVTPVTPEQQVQNKQTDLFNSYFQNQKAPADLMKIQNNLESQNQIRQKQEAVNTYQTQLNNITAKAQADVLSVTGQGRGIPEVIIGGQQAQINKEAAIQSLPVQAQLSAAQGDLQMAQTHVDKLFQIYAQDAQNKVDYYNKQATMVYSFLDKQQQQQLDTIRADKTFTQNTLLKTMDAQQGYAETALKNGSMSAFNAITGVRPPTDLNSPTYSQDYATYQQNLNRAVSKYGVGGGAGVTTASSISDAVNKIFLNKEANTPVIAKTVLAQLAGNKAISSGTRGKIAPAVEVLNAIDEFANKNIEGKFTGTGGVFGLAPLGQFFKGLVNMKDKEYILNKQDINAVNLKVQQWASGASLTPQQTTQVNDLTPTVYDSDSDIRTKSNGLYNFMLNQAEGNLITDGVNVQFPSVNLFEIRDLYDRASPEQRKVIEQTYFNK